MVNNVIVIEDSKSYNIPHKLLKFALNTTYVFVCKDRK